MDKIEVRVSGPLFDGRADRAVVAFLDDAKDEVAQQGLADVHHILDASIQHPTPYYETQIMTERVANDVVVHDRGIVYGPWLEGISERNRTTRFKGYHAFRKAAQALRHKVKPLSEHVLRKYLGRMQ